MKPFLLWELSSQNFIQEERVAQRDKRERSWPFSLELKWATVGSILLILIHLLTWNISVVTHFPQALGVIYNRTAAPPLKTLRVVCFAAFNAQPWHNDSKFCGWGLQVQSHYPNGEIKVGVWHVKALTIVPLSDSPTLNNLIPGPAGLLGTLIP